MALVVVMTFLVVVLGGLPIGFASTSGAEVDETNRASDEQSARQSLDRMRQDIHCAYAVQPAQQTLDALGNPTGGDPLTLPGEPPPRHAPDCGPRGGDAASALQWCTVGTSPTSWANPRLPGTRAPAPAFYVAI